jgi:hypothetical protein
MGQNRGMAMQPDIEKRFRRSHISAFDFDRAIEFVKEARKHHFRSIIYEALVISAIIYYARPGQSSILSSIWRASHEWFDLRG